MWGGYEVVFREGPVRTACPYCQCEVVTVTSHQMGTLTYLACACLFFFGYVYVRNDYVI